MSITGNIKFFKASKSLLENNTTMVASSGVGSEEYALDLNEFTYWRSVGSNDLTQESLVIEFESAVTLDRIALVDHNFKQFSVKYDVAEVWTDFANVIGLDGTKANIFETTFDKDTAYYEFDSISTTKIQILIVKTQVVDAQKYISQIICTEELGTFELWPKVSNIYKTKNVRKTRTLSGRISLQKSIETFRVSIAFANYPVLNTADIELIYTLFDLDDNFIIWLCGGRYGANYFGHTLRGYRLIDFKQVQITNSLSEEYIKNILKNPIKTSISLEETV